MLKPITERMGAGKLRRRAAKIARRREAGKVPLPVQEPIDRESDTKRRARIRQRRAESIRRSFDDPAVAARAIRMLGLPRTVKKAPAKRARKGKA